jgi:hypothetical protein
VSLLRFSCAANVSISVDNIKDREKWSNLVDTKHLGGIQLLADKDLHSDFILNGILLFHDLFLLIQMAISCIDVLDRQILV